MVVGEGEDDVDVKVEEEEERGVVRPWWRAEGAVRCGARRRWMAESGRYFRLQ